MLQTTSLKIKTPRFEFQERRLSNFIPTGSAPEKNQFAAVFAGMTATKCARPTLFSAKGAVSFQPPEGVTGACGGRGGVARAFSKGVHQR
jgi:hypothetical protein